MIRHPISSARLNSRIRRVSPTWSARAAQKTQALKSGTLRKTARIWSEIKQVYINLQGSKCAFCEKWIEDQKIEHDIEHFRPKKEVKRWTVPKSLRQEGVHINQPKKGSKPEPGYRLLTYHPQNYAVACKTCNSVMKKSYFPIAGTRQSDAQDPTKMKDERPYLIFPIGNFDDDPEDLIEFYGVSPRPKKKDGFKRSRALVTIELFKLDDWKKRKELLRDRAEFIEKLHVFLRRLDDLSNSQSVVKDSQSEIKNVQSIISRLTSPKFRHANCLRSYHRLWIQDRTEAEKLYKNIRKFLNSSS